MESHVEAKANEQAFMGGLDEMLDCKTLMPKSSIEGIPMSSSQIRADSIEKSQKASQKILWAIIAILLTISIPVALFLFDEWQRAGLLRTYSKVAASTNLPSQSGIWNTTLILLPNEVMACVLGSYGSTENLLELNAQQRKSLAK